MKNSKNDLGHLFKSEADEALFKEIEFTSKMKQEIRKKIQQESSPPFLVRLRGFKRKSFYGALVVAGLASVLWISSTLLHISNDPEVEETVPNLFTDENEGVNNPIDGTQSQYWEVASMEEAEELMGEDLLLPTYNPKHFTIDRIHLLGDEKSDPDKIIFTYVSGEKSYLIIIEPSENQLGYPNFEKIDINGTTGYLTGTENDSEIYLIVDELQYMIGGLISKEDAIKVAEGLQ